jgi:two-component system chemotaxis response regulator CheY
MFPANTKILVIDDFKTMRKVVMNALGQLGLKNIVEADDAADALPMIEAAAASPEPFGLIVSDWNMPKMKGIELLAKVRANPATAKLPFVLVTAEAETSNITEAIKLGVSNYIVKPFTMAGFSEKITAVYKKHAGPSAA